MLRFLAIAGAFSTRGAEAAGAARLPDAACPTYFVLAAIYDEVEIAPALVKVLGALDYPADRFAIRLVVEEGDHKTRAALATCVLPAHFAVMVVPRGTPRAKPRALTILVDLTPVELVVVYDAEDLPEREQLRLAAAPFSQAPAYLACLQARLNTTNYNEGGLGGSSQ